jgi:hypothetical protein
MPTYQHIYYVQQATSNHNYKRFACSYASLKSTVQFKNITSAHACTCSCNTVRPNRRS